ncbi:MAG: hypothetical protein IPP86_03930 [Bacteroidetes bacterium]|nr:hypothetical protein [Bacteroidota bacterium]MBL0137665.1 hypothetical protein [Bacteroidota bacterium]
MLPSKERVKRRASVLASSFHPLLAADVTSIVREDSGGISQKFSSAKFSLFTFSVNGG